MSPKTIIISLIVFFVAIVGLVFLFTPKQKSKLAVLSFSAQDTDRPRAETTQTFFDLGKIKVSDVKQQDFTLKNTGTQPLQILDINSNCGCTSGQIIYGNLTSKEYGMHAQSGYVTEIDPGDTAVIKLTYRPATMPVYGLVEREVYVTTNDPINQKLIFSIKAFVE